MNNYYFRLLSCFLIHSIFFSCSRVDTLNLKPHQFGEKAGKIVWIQFPGLEEQQLALLRFNLSSAFKVTALEKSQCVGQMWAFNLFELRPTAQQSFLSQVLGSKNIRNKCEDILEHQPVWNLLSPLGYQSVILEGSGLKGDESLSKFAECGEKYPGFIGNSIFLKMDKKANNQVFHYQEKLELEPGQIYYDKSCQGEQCFSSLANNIKSIWAWGKREKRRLFFLIRDFSYLHSLDKKDLNHARESLAEMDDIFQFFLDELASDEDITLILSSASVRQFEFPEQGQDWADFQKKSGSIIFHKAALNSPVFAVGPGAENFCGMFTEAEMLKRTLWRPQKYMGF